MRVQHVEVLVEEPSMETVLRQLLPQMLEKITFKIYTYQCKADLLKRLPERLCGYSHWLPDDWRILVVVDRDNDDCRQLKAQLEKIAAKAKLSTRSTSRGGFYSIVNRLAIEELEAWYFGDWAAVKAAYTKVPKEIPTQAKFRDPDEITGGTWEAFERILQRAGYFKSGLRKIEAAQAISIHMVPECNNSRSFQLLRHTMAEIVSS